MAQREKAVAERDAMFTSLKGRLTKLIGSDGPVAAILVCSKEAVQIAGHMLSQKRVNSDFYKLLSIKHLSVTTPQSLWPASS